MMSFCRRSVHSFLGFNSNSMAMETATSFGNNTVNNNNPPCKHGLGLIASTVDESHRPPNVIESSILKLFPLPLPPPPPLLSPLVSLPSVFAKKDSGGIGFIDDMGGGVNGLMSCTESLGFESSDERTVDDHHQMDELDVRAESSSRAKWRKDHHVDIGAERSSREIKKFPPPLSSFNHKGQPSFFLRSLRTDGRLELSEVRIDRPEILLASREDGRLRLHLIVDEDDDDDLDVDCVDGEQSQEREEEERVGEWKFQVSGSTEGYRRCNEMVSHHQHHHDHHHHHNLHPHDDDHHHNLHAWSQQCVPTR